MAASDLVQQFMAMREALGAPLPSVSAGRVSSPIATAFSAPTVNVRGVTAPLATAFPSSPQSGNLTPAEAWIIQRESGGRTTAKNPSSGAFGLGQLNPSSGTLQSISKQLGYDPYTTDYAKQLAMFRTYVKQRYGTAEKAQQFWQQHGWY